jgi:hypothetical protein
MQNDALVPLWPAPKMAESNREMPQDDAGEATASKQGQCPKFRLRYVIMVPLIPHVQSCRLNIQTGRFAIPVGDPRMVKTDSLPR